MTKPWFPPAIELFKRFQVADGLLINSEKWQIAHEYHRRRQNVHYQSVNQAGIVCGFAVHLLRKTVPGNSNQYEFFLKFQKGIAIDRYGNCIVLDQEWEKKIATKIATSIPKTVYFVVSYQEPVANGKEVVTEQFEIKERTEPPSENEVELCRIRLTSQRDIKISQNVFAPGDDELDFRYRPSAKWRSLSMIRTATYTDLGQWQEVFADAPQASNLSYLLQSLNSLYPSLEALHVGDSESSNPNLPTDYNLISVTDTQIQKFDAQGINILQSYLQTGGVILIEHLTNTHKIGGLIKAKQDLQQEIMNLEEELIDEREILTEELRSQTDTVKAILDQIAHEYNQKLNTKLQPLTELTNHPLRKTPFLFDQLPSINQQPISILADGGIIVVIGKLSSAWGNNGNLSLSRETIRSAQEMGINILHFAWRRKELTQLAKQ
ncbi:hypothetical protein FJR38_11100 [Anabaena sp. UHCC 0253]|uniref:hypothetical protein n=1 Tax=Anabaena sp. UHCC 0253 TaxID=2590019 RepID=UPI00144564AB|nr:hypothetical protein [Anabaena sp. UHCC 0253]MTJ53148.1 hypothetical protein [Anabaena sp. UHCC 0253]